MDGSSFWPQIFIKAKTLQQQRRIWDSALTLFHIKMHQPQYSVERPGAFNAFGLVCSFTWGVVHKYAEPRFPDEGRLSCFVGLHTFYWISLQGSKFMLKADPRKIDLKEFLQKDQKCSKIERRKPGENHASQTSGRQEHGFWLKRQSRSL